MKFKVRTDPDGIIYMVEFCIYNKCGDEVEMSISDGVVYLEENSYGEPIIEFDIDNAQKLANGILEAFNKIGKKEIK